MKTVFTSALIAAASIIAVPAFADLSDTTRLAVQVHNASVDSQIDRIIVSGETGNASFSTRDGGLSAAALKAIEIHNSSIESDNDRIKLPRN